MNHNIVLFEIKELNSLTASQAVKWSEDGKLVLRELEKFMIPVIAMIDGFALGGGLELAMACDLRIASDKSKFGLPEVKLGVIPGLAGTQRLARTIGVSQALEMMMTGKTIDAGEALELGLVNQVVPDMKLYDTCIGLAKLIISQSVFAVGMCKKVVYEGTEVEFESGSARESSLFGKCFGEGEQKEGMDAFINKRKPNFK